MSNDKTKKPSFEIPKLEPLYPNFNFPEVELPEITPLSELLRESNMELVKLQTEMINKQSETINQISALVGKQQEMIDDGKKESRETRFFTIVSLVIAIIAIVVN